MKVKTPVHRRLGKIDPQRAHASVCGADGLIYGAGVPLYPFPSDWGKTPEEQEYEWCKNCLDILDALAPDPDKQVSLNLEEGLDDEL